MRNSRIIRRVLNGLGAIDALLYASGIHQNDWLLGLGLIALFLGVTDFGRQCPLLLSLRNLVQTMKTKRRIEVGVLDQSSVPQKDTREVDALRRD